MVNTETDSARIDSKLMEDVDEILKEKIEIYKAILEGLSNIEEGKVVDGPNALRGLKSRIE